MKRSTKSSRKVKLEERHLTKEIVDQYVQGQLYHQLLNFEKSLDVLLRGKQLDINEALVLRPSRPADTLRVVVYNTYTNQNPSYRLGGMGEMPVTDPPSWNLKIEGYRTSEESYRYSSKAKKTRFSHFFSRVVVIMDKAKFPDNHTVEWCSSRHGGEFDGFEIKRECNTDTEVSIHLYLNYYPARFKLSADLGKLLDMHTETKPRIITTLWQYVKLHRLQDPKDHRHIRADANLRKLFGKEVITFGELPELVFQHLGPPDPIELLYTIRTSGSSYDYQKCFDITVDLEDISGVKSAYQTKELDDLDEEIATTVKSLRAHMKRKAFFGELGADPGTFLSKAVVSQISDYQTQFSDAGATPAGEEERRASFFFQPFSIRAAKKHCANIEGRQ